MNLYSIRINYSQWVYKQVFIFYFHCIRKVSASPELCTGWILWILPKNVGSVPRDSLQRRPWRSTTKRWRRQSVRSLFCILFSYLGIKGSNFAETKRAVSLLEQLLKNFIIHGLGARNSWGRYRNRTTQKSSNKFRTTSIGGKNFGLPLKGA